MDNFYLKKYLKYKLKYFKIKGGVGGVISSTDFDTCVGKSNMPIVDKKNKKYLEFMKKCRDLSDTTESAYFKITKSAYFDCITNFHKNQDLKELTTAAKSAYNSVFKTDKSPGSVYLKATEPTYDFDEIELLISLNDINKNKGENIFTPFYKIIFDTSRLEYYLEFKLYTSDLHTYLMKICVTLEIDKIIKLLKSINEILNYKLNILLDIEYLTCLDIKLKNILISYNEKFDIEEIVLHDFDMIACCSRKTNTESCTKYSYTNKYMLIYYKLILFFQSYKIIKSIPDIACNPDIKSLFQDELKAISDNDLQDFFKNFINARTYKSDKDYVIPNLPIEEKMHLFFHNYILNLIINSKPSILRDDSNYDRILSKILPKRFKDMILHILKGNPTEKEYVSKLPDIFKGIFKGEIILYE
jgi:hypothetical protein